MQRQKPFLRTFFFFFLLACLLTGLMGRVRVPVNAAPPMQVVTHLVISQIYGGGGDSSAIYTHDYIELFNPSDVAISVNGWSVQYATAGGGSWVATDLSGFIGGSLAAGQYLLVQLASGGANGSALPSPDVIGATNMSAIAGKVALVNSTVPLSGPCPSDTSIIDFVGFGTSVNCFDGNAPAPAPSNTTAVLRNNRCIDLDDNDLDFDTGAPNPQNSATTAVSCSTILTNTAVANLTAAANLTSTAAVNQTGTAVANLTSTAVASNLTGTAAAYLTTSPTPTATLGACGVGAPPISVIISEIAWGGTGASINDEWIELYNPTSGPVNLSGWSLKALDGTPNISLSNFNLASGQFYLLERGADTVVSDVTANQIYPITPNPNDLGNFGDVLQLYNSSGVCVDTANSNGGAWPAGTGSTPFYSMERRGVVSDSDTAWITNVNSASWTKHDARGTSSTNFLIHGTPGYANWAFSVTPTPAPLPTSTLRPTATRTPTPPPPPPLIAINEFVPRPGHDWNNDGVVNFGDEYIELLNHGVIPVSLSGYTLDDEVNIGSTPYPLPAVTLQPGERMVFYGSDTGLLLSDGGDGVRLLKPNGQLGDAYNYTIVRHPDQSFCRLPDNGGLDDWNQNCFPTPGLKNALGSGVLNPPVSGGEEPLCPIPDTLPQDFVLAECPSFGNIWSRYYWDKDGWFGEMIIPNIDSQWEVYVD